MRLISNLCRTALFCCLFFGLASTLLAQPPTDDGPDAPDVAPPAGPVTGKPPAEKDRTIREQTIYVPYTKLRTVFEKDGRGVFLPYDEFQRLWQQARRQLVPETKVEPPVKAFITEVASVASVGPDVVTVRAEVDLEILTPGWHEVPLRLADAAILSARFGDQPARLMARIDRGYYLLLEKKGDKPEQRKLTLEYAKAFTKAPGRNQVSFQAPQAPVNRWELRIPESGVKVNIHPLIAASEVLPNSPARRITTNVLLAANRADAKEPGAPPSDTPSDAAANTDGVEGDDDAGKAGQDGPAANESTTDANEADGDAADDAASDDPASDDPASDGPGSDDPASDDAASDDANDGDGGNAPKDDAAPDDKGATDAAQVADAAAPPADQTRILAFVGAAPTVEFDWTPKSEGATGLSALANVQAEQKVSIDEGVITTSTHLVYDISRASVTQLRVEVPADHKVTGVFDPNVRQWEVETEDNVQRIVAQLFDPTQGTQKLVVELEKFMTDITAAPVTVPVVKALDVARQQGVVVARISSALRGEVTAKKGLIQLDSTELKASGSGKAWQVAYRYATLPFELTFDVDKVQPRVTTRELVELYVEPRVMSVDLLSLFTIERAGVFQLELEIPTDFTVRRVVGRAAAGAEAPLVDTYNRVGDNKERLQVNLARRAQGKIGLHIELEKRLDDANLLSPTGESSSLTFTPPRADPNRVDLSSGSLIVYAPESLQVTPTGDTGLRGVSFQEALDGTQSLRGNRRPQVRPILAYSFAKDAPKVDLQVERRKPYVTVRQLLEARIESGVIQYRAQFFYNIRYSGLPSLRLDVPQDLASRIRNDTPGINESVPEELPEDLAEGYTSWTLQSRGPELFGDVTVRLSWEEQIDELDVGASTRLALPRLAPRDTDRAWGQILLAKAENLDLRPAGELVGLRPIDPQVDLMAGGDGSGAARAFEFHADWSLSVDVTRYQLEEVKRTSIERALVRAVVTREVENREQQTLVQALFRVRSVRQRLALSLPSEVSFAANPLRVNGQVVSLERGDQGEFYVPLAGRNLDEPLLLEIRYSAPGSYRNLTIPVFPEEPAVQKVYLCAYLPEELAVVGSRGPWTSEVILQLREMIAGIPAVRHSDEELLSWVSEGFSVANVPDFLTEGDLHVYSALRPAKNEALQLIAVRHVALNGVLLAVIVGIGLLLLVRPLRDRLLFLVFLLAGLIGSAVFMPTLAVQLLNGALAAGVVLIVALWIAVSLGRALPGLATSLLQRQPAAVAATATAPAAVPASGPPSSADVASATGPPPRNPESSAEAGGGATSGESPFASSDEAGRSDSHDDSREGGESNA